MTECRLIRPDTLLVTRRYRAKRDLIWAAWTQPERLKRWFGTPGYTLETVEIDLRVGGKFRKVFRTSDDELITVQGEYREVDEPARLVYTWNVTGSDRNLVDSLVTVSLTEHGDEVGFHRNEARILPNAIQPAQLQPFPASRDDFHE